MHASHLEGQPLFAGLSKKQRASVAAHADEIDVPAGKELVHEGSMAWDFFVIEAGAAQVAHGADVVATLGPGDFFGEIAVMSAPGGRRTASVMTTSPMKAIVITSHELRALAVEMPEIAQRLRSAIAERTRALVTQ